MKNLLLVVFLGFCLQAIGQQGEPANLFPGMADTTKKSNTGSDKIVELNPEFGSKKGEVKSTKDERIDKLLEFMGTPQTGDPDVKIRGYRVQLIFDSDKELVNAKRAEYLGSHSEHPAYTDYKAPNHRLRVGNFRTRLQAEEWAHELIISFPDAVIVEDWIDLPGLHIPEGK